MNTKEIQAKDGERYTLSIDDFGTEISVAQDGGVCGSISLSLITGDLHDPDYFYITHLALEPCMGRGVGRQCLIFHKECFGDPIAAGDNDGHKRGDGSHLTGSGPGFIEQMRREGLIIRSNSERWDRYDEWDE